MNLVVILGVYFILGLIFFIAIKNKRFRLALDTILLEIVILILFIINNM